MVANSCALSFLLFVIGSFLSYQPWRTWVPAQWNACRTNIGSGEA
jgi:hypothetical protein